MKRVISSILAGSIGLAVCGGFGVAFAQAEPEEATEAAELSATERALGELAAAYEGLAGLLGQGSDQAVDRVQEDIENLGDWEYRIVLLSNRSPEALEVELNLLGDDRWEVFWIQPVASDVRVYLKRPSISYLSRVPLSTLVRLLAGGAQ
jgi:phosphoglycolate phosphatase-like HAD superfamily hydrolase